MHEVHTNININIVPLNGAIHPLPEKGRGSLLLLVTTRLVEVCICLLFLMISLAACVSGLTFPTSISSRTPQIIVVYDKRY